jgi:hypothetical protein
MVRSIEWAEREDELVAVEEREQVVDPECSSIS